MDYMYVLILISMVLPSGAIDSDFLSSDKDWEGKFKPLDEQKTFDSMEKSLDKKIADSIKRSEISMIKSKKKTSYITINQDVHLGKADEKVSIQKLAIWERIARIASNYPWVSVRKMTVMWKTGVSNNVKWTVKMSFMDRRDNNEDTRELFMIEYPVSDNFIMMMAPGYTAYMSPSKGLLPWRFDFDFPDGEFTDRTIFGTLKIKMEIDQYREATQVDEIIPLVRFTRVVKSVDEPTIRWMSKGRWYQSTATKPDAMPLNTIESSLDDINMKYQKFLAFLGFDTVKMSSLPFAQNPASWIDSEDLRSFELSPLTVAKSYAQYQAKYKEIVRRQMSSSVYSNKL